jgi:Spy/CpxP family protein refolding chaperone
MRLSKGLALSIVVGGLLLAAGGLRPISAQAGSRHINLVSGSPREFGEANSMPGERPAFHNFSGAGQVNRALVRLSRALDLTAAQQTAVQAIITAESQTTTAVRQQIQTDLGLISAAAILLPYDEAAIALLAERLGADQATLARYQAAAENQVYALLTSEQQALYAKLQHLVGSLF